MTPCGSYELEILGTEFSRLRGGEGARREDAAAGQGRELGRLIFEAKTGAVVPEGQSRVAGP